MKKWLIHSCLLILLSLPALAWGQASLNDKWFGSFQTCTGGVPCVNTQMLSATGGLTGALAQASLNDLLYMAFQNCSGTPCLTVTGSGGSGGTPGGSNTQFQYNNSGSFGGASGLTYNNSTNAVTFSTSLTGPLLMGGIAAGSTLTLQSTSNGTPVGDELRFVVGGARKGTWTQTGLGIRNTSPAHLVDITNVSGDAVYGINMLHQITTNFGGLTPTSNRGIFVQPVYRGTNTLNGPDVAQIGIQSLGTYGGSGTSPKGSAIGGAFTWAVESNSDGTDETVPLYFATRVDIGDDGAGHSYPQTTGPVGRHWLVDSWIHGPLGVQPEALNGMTVGMNNQYNGQGSFNYTYVLGLITYPGKGGSSDAKHIAANTYPVDAGLAIVGKATGTAAGFNKAIQIGGSATSWMGSVSGPTGSSQIGTGIDITQYGYSGGSGGIYLHGASAGKAIQVDSDAGAVNIASSLTLTSAAMSASGAINSANLISFAGASINNTGATQAFTNFQMGVVPGAAITTLYGSLILPTLQSSSSNLTTGHGHFARLDTASSYTGTITTYNAFMAGNPTLSGSHITTYNGFNANAWTGNGAGKTSGTWNNNGVNIAANSTEPGSGGTLNNTAAKLAKPSGNVAGNNNKALWLTGAASTSASSDWAFYSDSTAPSLFTANVLMPIPTSQTIAGGDTVTADACGGVKRISSAGAVTTSTTNTFTAPAASNAGCVMSVCNVGANNITLDNNANFKSPGGADVVMTADDCILVGSTGASGVWYALTALVAN